MPNCYSLTPINGTEPERLIAIDEKMCAHFGAEPHPTLWFRNWENNIGMLLACGRSWEEIKKACKEDGTEFGNELFEVAEWLEQHYTSDAWAEIGRR